MTRMIYDEHELPRPSTVDSWVRARNSGILQEAKAKEKSRDCPYCLGSGYYEYDSSGLARCVCWLSRKEYKYRKIQELATRHDRLEWSDFELWGKGAGKIALVNALASVKSWMKKVDSWLYLAGPVGTGKSHLLHTIDSYFYPWSFYVSVPDLKDLVFEFTAKRDLQLITDKIAKHPILILDDVGAEYTSEYAVSMVRQIIMTRYKRWQEYPVISATNLTESQMIGYDDRLADRMWDTEKVKHVYFTGVESWRRRNGN